MAGQLGKTFTALFLSGVILVQACSPANVLLKAGAHLTGTAGGVLVRIDSMTTPGGCAAKIVDASVSITNGSDRPFVINPEDITLVDAAGYSTTAAQKFSQTPNPPIGCIFMYLPLLPVGIILLPVALVQTQTNKKQIEEQRKKREAHFWGETVIDPGSEKSFLVYFYEGVDVDKLSMLRVRNPISGTTIQSPLAPKAD